MGIRTHSQHNLQQNSLVISASFDDSGLMRRMSLGHRSAFRLLRGESGVRPDWDRPHRAGALLHHPALQPHTLLLLMSPHIPNGLPTVLRKAVTQSTLSDHSWFLCFSLPPLFSSCVSLICLSAWLSVCLSIFLRTRVHYHRLWPEPSSLTNQFCPLDS